MEFSTRKGPQAGVVWEPCTRIPDTQTMMVSLFRNRFPGAGSRRPASVKDITVKRVGAFVLGYSSEELPCQALCYLQNRKKLLRWVFAFSRASAIKKVWIPILESFEPNDGEMKEYAVYGLDFRLPADFLVTRMSVLPANVMIGFQNGKKISAGFRRWGMTEFMLAGQTLSAFYRAFVHPKNCVVSDIRETEIAGMEAVKASYEQRGQHRIDRFMKRTRKNGEAWLWYNREEMRIYAFEQVAPDRVPLLNVENVFPGLRS